MEAQVSRIFGSLRYPEKALLAAENSGFQRLNALIFRLLTTKTKGMAKILANLPRYHLNTAS